MNMINTSVKILSLRWLIMVRQSEFHFAMSVSNLSFSPPYKGMLLSSDFPVEEGCPGVLFLILVK